jgi:hypothetical protein
MAELLGSLLGMSDSVRRSMGDCARRLVETSFSRDRAATEILAVYQWLHEGGPPPPSVLGRVAL